MKARIRKGILILKLPLINPPRKSRSGKTHLVASSRGVRRTSARIDKNPVYVNANAFVRPDKQSGTTKSKISKLKALRTRARER